MEKISISININALGCPSGDFASIPLEDFADGKPVILNGYLKPIYHPYVKPIKLSIAGNTLSIESPYMNDSIPLDSGKSFWIKGIGLSYAVCDITISVD